MSETFKYLHTTKVNPQDSAAQMMAILARIGASRVSMDMDTNNQISGMSFETKLGDQVVQYRMPVKWKPVYDSMLAEARKSRAWRHGRKSIAEKEAEILLQAKRTAWRLALDWLKIQAAFIQNNIRHPAEVFMADMIVRRDGRTDTMGTFLLENEGLKRLTSSQENP